MISHKFRGYRELSTAQKRELSEWRDKDSEKKKKPHNEKSRETSAAVTKALTDMIKSKEESDLTNAIVSCLLKATMSGTDTMKQNGEVAAVINSSTNTKRLPNKAKNSSP